MWLYIFVTIYVAIKQYYFSNHCVYCIYYFN